MRAQTLKKVNAWSGWKCVIYSLLCGIGVFVVALFGYWWFSFEHIPQNFTGSLHVFDFVLFALLTYVVWYQIVNELFIWWTGFFMKHPVPMEPISDMKVALLTAFVPDKEPYEILERALIAMRAVEYPHDTWVLDEGNDATVKKLCKKYGARHFSRKGIAQYNTEEGHFKARTKAGNYNAWFDVHGSTYEYIAQHDVDFAPRPDFLIKTLGYFRDPAVAFVGTPQIYGNVNESWIARAAAEQAYGFYGPIQKGLFGQDMQLFIGANHVIRTEAHHDIGGYSGHIVEDHLTGMRLYARTWKSVYVPEVLLVGEGPATWEAYFSQQMRWAYGLIDILFRHTPQIAPKMRPRHAINYILLQQYYFFGLAQIVGLFLIGLYFIFGLQATVMDITTLLILYPLFLIMQIIIALWVQFSYIDPKKESGIHLLGKFLNVVVWPIYVLAFVSALVNRKITYQVTPKGSAQSQNAPHLGIFTTQITVGTLSALVILAAFLTGRNAPMLMFWALVTMSFMYFTVAYIVWTKIREDGISPLAHKLLRHRSVAKGGISAIAIGFLCMSAYVFNASLLETERSQIATAYRSIPQTTFSTKTPALLRPVHEETGIENDTAAADRETEETLSAEAPITHIVQNGEYLRLIAQHYFNDETAWPRIQYEGNPDLIYPGDLLIIQPDPVS